MSVARGARGGCLAATGRVAFGDRDEDSGLRDEGWLRLICRGKSLRSRVQGSVVRVQKS